MGLITLTTDFGANDWFVGAMKGVIFGINPQATLVDITHNLCRGDIRAGAFALMASHRFFPKHTVHVAVVDPGVGSERNAIAVQTADYAFVGPDNGVLSWALRHEKVRTIRRLENAKFFLQPVSRTFHGRDIFAPVAAQLSKGLSFAKLGPEQSDYVRLPWPEPKRSHREVAGEVLYIDYFGNAITNLSGESLLASGLGDGRVYAGRKVIRGLKHFYQHAREGELLAIVSSSGFLEIAINGGSAAKTLRLKVGDPVTVQRTTDRVAMWRRQRT
jgi:S-adenosylmethionine hydrolase